MALSRLEDGRYIDVNLAFLHAFGYARDEVIGRTAEEIGIWENPERDRSPIVAQLSERGYVADYEATFRTKNGELLQFLLGATRIDTDDGPILLIVGRNITEIRRSEARYRSFIEGLPLGVLIAQDGIVQYGNPAGLELSGYELDEVVGKPFLLWVDEADREFLIANHQRRMQGDEADTCYDLRVMAKGGNKRYWRVHASTVTWEGRAAGLVAFSDVTAQKLAEARVTDLALHDIVTGLPLPTQRRMAKDSRYFIWISIISRRSMTASVMISVIRCWGRSLNDCAIVRGKAIQRRESAATSSSCWPSVSATVPVPGRWPPRWSRRSIDR